MPAFAVSAVFDPRCPRPAAVAVCALLALTPFVELAAIAAHAKFLPLTAHTAQPALMGDMPAHLEMGTASAPHQSLYTPVAYDGRKPRPPFVDERFRFYR